MSIGQTFLVNSLIALVSVPRSNWYFACFILVPPKFTVFPGDQEVSVDGRIELECVAEGQPTPVLNWQKNGTIIPGNTTYSELISF